MTHPMHMPHDAQESLDSPSADLTSWDFLQDVDLAFDSGSYAANAASTSVSDTYSKERLKEKNRQAQKRARQRKKERSESIEAQLAETTSQLHELRLRQRQLEARNSLLEKVAVLNKQQDADYLRSPSGEQARAREVMLKILTRVGLARTATGAIVLTVRQAAEELQPDDINKMPLTEFAKLSTAYARKQGQNLLDIQDNTDPAHPSLLQLQRLSLEMSALWTCFCIAGPHNIGTLHAINMQDGTLHRDTEPEPPPFELLEILNYSEQQKQDMMQIRKLFYGKLGQLQRQRTDLLNDMGDETKTNHPRQFNIDFKHTAARVAETQEFANRLCANRAEENRAYIYLGVSLFVCIQTSVQHAKAVVHKYPRATKYKDVLETLASQRGEPASQDLLEPAGLDDLQHAANWDAVIQWVETIDATGLHGHFPLFHPAPGADIGLNL